MDLNGYQAEARAAARKPWPFAGDPTLDAYYAAGGMASEGGECLDEIKKAIRDDGGVIDPQRKEKILLEAGDNLFYIAHLCDVLDTTLETLALMHLRLKLGPLPATAAAG